jgi:hypothetical protein
MFWGRVLQAGLTPLNTAGGWAGTIILLAGAAAGIVVPVVSHISPWLTAVVLLGLLVVVIAEGGYRVWHATDQSRAAAITERNAARAETKRRQSKEQRAATARQAEIQELQAQELRVSLEHREREAEAAREQREREAAERRRAQATRVLMREERLDYDPRVPKKQRATHPGSSTATMTVRVKNTSDQPVYDVTIMWQGDDWHGHRCSWGKPDQVGTLTPGAEAEYTRSLPERVRDYWGEMDPQGPPEVPPGYVDPRTCEVEVYFRDAARVVWRRLPDGSLDEF